MRMGFKAFSGLLLSLLDPKADNMAAKDPMAALVIMVSQLYTNSVVHKISK